MRHTCVEDGRARCLECRDLEVALWEAINRYAVTVGGKPSALTHDNKERQQAVAAVGAVLRSLATKQHVDQGVLSRERKLSSEEIEAQRTRSSSVDTCWCSDCEDRRGARDPSLFSRTMCLCPTCGNKRCPRATNHELGCSGSNELGQQGSRYA